MTGGFVQREPRPLMAWFVTLLMIVPALSCIDFGSAPVKAASSRALVFDTEPNNGYTEAQPIVLGDIVKGQLEVNNDNKDVYKVHIIANTVINLSFVQKEWNPLKPTERDVNVEFIGPGPVHSLVRREDKLWQIETISALCIETGDYYVWLYLGLNSLPVNYTMNINESVPQVIGRVTDMPGTLDATMTTAGTNPNKWFKLSIPTSKGIQVTLTVPKGSDFDLFALDQWDRLNFYIPGHRNPLWLNASTDNTTAGNFEFIKAVAFEGNYYLRIKAWPTSKGQYKLTVIDFDPVESDGDNTPTDAKEVTKKTLYHDHLQMSTDHFDWKKVYMTKNEKINVTFTLLTNTYDIYNMSVYDQNLNYIKGVFDTVSGNVYSDTNPVNSKCIIRNFTANATGYYYFMVMPVRNIDQLDQATFRPLDSDYSILFDLPDKGPSNILDLPAISFPEDTTYSALNITKYFDDPEDDPLTYSFSPSYLPNLTVSIAMNGTVTMKPMKDWNTGVGSMPITFKVVDSWTNTGQNYATASTTIKVTPVDDPPYILGELPSITFNETETGTMQGTLYDVFKDIDTSNLTFKVKGNGTIPVKIDNIEGSVVVGPVDGFFGTVVCNITAWDTTATPAWANLSISVRHKNHAPTVVGPATRYLNITEDQVGAQVLTVPWFTDKDISYAGDNLTFSLGAPLPTNLMATIDTGLVKIVPLQDWYGKDTIIIVAKDQARVEAKVTLIVTVSPINDQPKIITVQPPQRDPSMKEGSNMTFKVVKVSDPDKNQTITYVWTVEGAIQSTTEGTFNFVTDNDPNSATPSTGLYHIKVEVSDGLLKDSFQWNITVTDVNMPPANVGILLPKAGASYREGNTIIFRADNATDLEGDYISYTWRNNATGVVLGTGKEYKTKDLKKGSYVVTLEVSDGNSKITKNVSFTVLKKKTDGGPGFEAAWLLLALAVAFIVLSRRRNK